MQVVPPPWLPFALDPGMITGELMKFAVGQTPPGQLVAELQKVEALYAAPNPDYLAQYHRRSSSEKYFTDCRGQEASTYPLSLASHCWCAQLS